MKRNKPFTPYEDQIKTLKIEKANLIAERDHLTTERDRYKAERDELIQAGEEFLSSFYDQSMGRSIDRKFAEWQLLIARIREEEKEEQS